MSKDVTREITVYAGKRRPKKANAPAPIREKAPGTPTPERAAKETEAFATAEVVPGNVYQEAHVAHKVQLAIDVYRKHFSQDELEAAEMFYRDIASAMRQMVTANYDGSTRSTPGPRAGGVDDKSRESYVRIEAILRRLTRREKRVLLALVVGLRNELHGRAASVQDIARESGASYADAASLAKVSTGLLKGALDRTFEEYRKYQNESRVIRKLTEIEQSNRARALKGPR